MDPAPTTPASASRHGLPWWPALDGLRGLAVAAVLLYHHDAGLVPGGFLGVSLFFTLSGFLITSLLVAEHRATSTVDLRRFWGRRARRLVPASCLGVALGLLVARTYPVEARGEVLGSAAAAAANVANWYAVADGATYGDLLGFRSPVEHYWSLAIEEQFYLVFPILAVLALRRAGRRGLAAVLLFGTALSVAAQVLMDRPGREYLGTDTRAAELLVGGLLALALGAGARAALARRRLTAVASTVALAATVALWLRVDLGTPGLYRGGLLLVACASAALIAGAVTGGPVARAMGWAPLCALGRISYGVYVVHLPVFLYLDAERTGLDGPMLLAARLAATLALAGASWVVLERPIRYGARLRGWAGPAAYATAIASVLVAVAGVAAVTTDATRATEAAALAPFAPAGDPGTAVAPRVSPSTAPADGGPAAAVPPPGELASPTTGPPPAPPPRRPVNLVVVGDSTARYNGVGFQVWAERSGSAEIRVATHNASTVLRGDAARFAPGYERTDVTEDRFQQHLREAAALHPDAIVVFVGSAQLADWRLTGDPVWRAFGDAVYDTAYVAALEDTLVELEQAGIPVLWADVPPARWEPAVPDPPSVEEVTLNDPARAVRLNTLTDPLLAAHPNIGRVDYARIVAPDGTVDPAWRPDGLHMDPEVIAQLLAGPLGEELRRAYQAVLADPAANVVPVPTPHVWAP